VLNKRPSLHDAERNRALGIARRGTRAETDSQEELIPMSTMSQATFSQFRSIVYEHSGIDLAPGKEALVAGRIGKRMRALGIDDLRSYLHYLEADQTEDELVKLLDVISTNVTHFFREQEHFDILHGAVGQWLAAGQRTLRIWSAACSSGEEPYTIGMTLLSAMRSQAAALPDMRILATDISTRVLEHARQGIYRAGDLRQVPASLRNDYFSPLSHGGQTMYEVSPELRKLVTFRRLNLSRPPFPMQGPLDAVFCRNVMIYFDQRVRSRLIAEIERLLKPGGLLLIGHAESLTGIPNTLRLVRPSVYQREGA
jgi:chemotaxis protein methyltransferase CheR